MNRNNRIINVKKLLELLTLMQTQIPLLNNKQLQPHVVV